MEYIPLICTRIDYHPIIKTEPTDQLLIGSVIKSDDIINNKKKCKAISQILAKVFNIHATWKQKLDNQLPVMDQKVSKLIRN